MSEVEKQVTPGVGDLWFYIHAGSTFVSDGIIHDMTEKTIVFTKSKYSDPGPRYLLSSIQFVERFRKANEF